MTLQKVLMYVKCMLQEASVPPTTVQWGSRGCVAAGVTLSPEYLHHRSDLPYPEPVPNRNCLDQVTFIIRVHSCLKIKGMGGEMTKKKKI